MTEADLEVIVQRVSQGEGVEAILASLGIDSDLGCQWLKDHPEAKGRIQAAKDGAIAHLQLRATIQ